MPSLPTHARLAVLAAGGALSPSQCRVATCRSGRERPAHKRASPKKAPRPPAENNIMTRREFWHNHRHHLFFLNDDDKMRAHAWRALPPCRHRSCPLAPPHVRTPLVRPCTPAAAPRPTPRRAQLDHTTQPYYNNAHCLSHRYTGVTGRHVFLRVRYRQLGGGGWSRFRPPPTPPGCFYLSPALRGLGRGRGRAGCGCCAVCFVALASLFAVIV